MHCYRNAVGLELTPLQSRAPPAFVSEELPGQATHTETKTSTGDAVRFYFEWRSPFPAG